MLVVCGGENRGRIPFQIWEAEVCAEDVGGWVLLGWAC